MASINQVSWPSFSIRNTHHIALSHTSLPAPRFWFWEHIPSSEQRVKDFFFFLSARELFYSMCFLTWIETIRGEKWEETKGQLFRPFLMNHPPMSLPIPSQEKLEFFHAKKNRGQEETNYDLVCVLCLNCLIYRPWFSDYGWKKISQCPKPKLN